MQDIYFELQQNGNSFDINYATSLIANRGIVANYLRLLKMLSMKQVETFLDLADLF